MKTWLWTGGEWRQLSDVEAEYRRAAGFIVVDAEEAPVDPPKPLEQAGEGAPPAPATPSSSKPTTGKVKKES